MEFIQMIINIVNTHCSVNLGIENFVSCFPSIITDDTMRVALQTALTNCNFNGNAYNLVNALIQVNSLNQDLLSDVSTMGDLLNGSLIKVGDNIYIQILSDCIATTSSSSYSTSIIIEDYYVDPYLNDKAQLSSLKNKLTVSLADVTDSFKPLIKLTKNLINENNQAAAAQIEVVKTLTQDTLSSGAQAHQIVKAIDLINDLI